MPQGVLLHVDIAACPLFDLRAQNRQSQNTCGVVYDASEDMRSGALTSRMSAIGLASNSFSACSWAGESRGSAPTACFRASTITPISRQYQAGLFALHGSGAGGQKARSPGSCAVFSGHVVGIMRGLARNSTRYTPYLKKHEYGATAPGPVTSGRREKRRLRPHDRANPRRSRKPW